MNKTILVDADGVIIDWEYAFNVWATERGYTLQDAKKYPVGKRYGITSEEGNALVRQFNESSAVGFMPALRDSAYYVKRLHEEHGYKFHCITSLSKDKNAQKLRKMNIQKLFGKTTFEEFIFLDTGADKDQVLEQYRDSGLYWVEDKYMNARVGADLGLKSILMEHGHNMDFLDPRVIVVKNWKQIYSIITGEVTQTIYYKA